MEYLTEKYWEKINNEMSDNKGISFENLVRDLLIAEYGKAAFQSTKHSWDGSKDFFYYSRQRNFWAECKNYASSIDLKVLASTLIMAQLSEIDTVLFYSYSPINVNTKAKLLINAEKKGKTIYFYDDIALERKIFENWDYIGELYFPDYSYTGTPIVQSEHSYEAKCLLYGNPLDISSTIDGYELDHLTLFKMFEMNICVINRKNVSNTLSLKFKKIDDIKSQFEVYHEHTIKSKTVISLAPYEGKNIQIWFIPVKENCTIPNPFINNKRLSLPKSVEFKAIKIINRNNRRLIGKSYEKCLLDFKQRVLFETDKLKVGIFYGNSGTGKSKLYEECLNISKISGYEIIDFCSIPNAPKLPSVQEFIQKLLIAIYGISLDTIEQIFKAATFCTDDDPFLTEQPEYRMIAEIFHIATTDDMQKWLNQYLNLVVLQLAKNKFIIAIDNIQFLRDDIIDLIDNICNQLINIPYCDTKFLFTFNLDYIKRNSKADIFLGNYTSNRSISVVKHIKGFENSQECYEFLQETLSIGNIFQKVEIDSIAENLNKNPFYLEQMIYWLVDKNVLEQLGNHYTIKNVFLFKSLIRNIPNTVFDILEERWNYYRKCNKLDFEKTIILFSAIHLYKELEKKDIDDLKISWDTIKELEKMGFIALEDTINVIAIKFRHDILDKFFSKMYSSFSKKIIDYENQHNIALRENKLRYYLGKLYTEKSDLYLSSIQISEMLTIHVDSELAYEFYLLLFEKYLASFEQNYPKNKTAWINNIYQIIVCVHDILGNAVMKKCANSLLLKVQNIQEIYHYLEYGKVLLYISEAYDSMGDYQDAVSLIKNYKNKAFGSKAENINTLEQKMLLSEIYNRLHVYCRHQVLYPLENDEVMGYLNTSTEIANDISYAVMQYVNYSDKGYLYYDLPLSDEKHINTMFYWQEACKIYERGGAEAKELNYLRKKVQLALLQGDAEKAIHATETGLEQVDLSPNAYQQTFFKWWFYHALAEGYLLNYKPENAAAIEKALERAHFYSELLESNKKFYYLQLSAINMYYSGKKDEATALNKEAIELVEVSNYKKKKKSLKCQLLENEATLSSANPKPQNNMYSQIYTIDRLFNLPCI